MYSISAFSKLSNTSIQTLRYYDTIKLLKPRLIGEFNNYRYYTNEELTKIKVIKKLKKMGFKLKEILNILNNYDKKSLLNQIDKLKNNINVNNRSIKEIEEIITKMNNPSDLKKELVYLINKEERSKKNMKEKYNSAKEKLLKCYDLYVENNFIDCISLLEDLKNEIFETSTELDPYWLNSAGDLFEGITFEIFKNSKKEDVTFLNIFKLKINNEDNIDNITEYVNKLDKESYSYINLSGISMAPIDTKNSIIAVFKQNMKVYAVFETNK